MTEHTIAKNSLLNSYLIINQLLEMDYKSKYYRELKNRLTNEELEVVKYLQHSRSQEKLNAKKENNLEVNSSRGRKGKRILSHQMKISSRTNNRQLKKQPRKRSYRNLIQLDTRATLDLFSNLLYHVQRVILLIVFLFVYLISYKQE